MGRVRVPLGPLRPGHYRPCVRKLFTGLIMYLPSQNKEHCIVCIILFLFIAFYVFEFSRHLPQTKRERERVKKVIWLSMRYENNSKRFALGSPRTA